MICDSSSIPRFQQGWLPACEATGAHFCKPRALFAQTFFERALVHTKGRHARRAFILADWQREDIIHPLFGNVSPNEELGIFRRDYRMGWIELARKNGKSELLAGVALYMLTQDGEEGAEIYGAAKDRDQARIIWNVAMRMVQLSPALSRRRGLRIRSHEKRIVDERTGSFYGILARDALGNLGLDPSAMLFDEVIAQPDDLLWNTMRTAMGSRSQPLMLAATTAGNDPSSFAAAEHNECVRIADDPTRAPHRFTYIRNTPAEADPFDQRNWPHANPALGDFLAIEALRDEAVEARNDPAKENAFRQYRLNQWVNQSSRWMPMHLYRECTGDIWPTSSWRPRIFKEREVWVGLDLSAKQDLTSMCVFTPPLRGEPGHAAWYHWLPEEALSTLNQVTSGQAQTWVKQGFLRLMEGAVINYEKLCDQIAEILSGLTVREVDYDKWSGEYVRQELLKRLGRRTPMVSVEPTFVGMSIPMRELMELTVVKGWRHHNNPVAMYCFDSVQVKRAVENDQMIKPVKPERSPSKTRIDAVVTAALAIGAWRIRGVNAQGRGAVGF
jgi:phage terminase large subunit-like protein